MHGLTGGSWKRKRHRPRLKRKLPAGKPRQERQTYSRTIATAPAPDPPSDVIGFVFPASGARGGDTEAAWRRHENPWGAYYF